MCCSPAATKGAARAVPVVLGEAPKDAASFGTTGGNNNNVVVVVVASSARQHHHRFGRPSPASAARPLAVRRTAPAPRQSQTRVSREDLDRVRIALEQELAAGGAFSDDDIVERVSSSRRLHPLVVSIVLSKLREQNPEFFASYDAKRRRENSTTATTAEPPASASVVSTSTAVPASSSGDAGDGDGDEGCNTTARRDESSSSDDDAVVPLFA